MASTTPHTRALAALLALGACTTERPENAYEPFYGEPCDPLVQVCADLDAGDASRDSGMDARGQDADVPDDDGGGLVVNPDNRLSKLAGRYLMRVDYYTTAMADGPSGSKLQLKTRISNLFYTELSDGEGVLNATEKLCDQEAAHECLMSCSNWKTQYGLGVTALMQSKDPLRRAYTVDANNNLIARPEGALLPMGFDDAAPVPLKIPLEADDTVWSIPSAPRGVVTKLTASLMAFGVTAPLSCTIGSVQLYSTAFQAKLASIDQTELATHIMEVNTTGSAGTVVSVLDGGEPADYCKREELNKPPPSDDERAFVRFKPTQLRGCPANAAAFDEEFPAYSNIEPPTPSDAKP